VPVAAAHVRSKNIPFILLMECEFHDTVAGLTDFVDSL